MVNVRSLTTAKWHALLDQHNSHIYALTETKHTDIAQMSLSQEAKKRGDFNILWGDPHKHHGVCLAMHSSWTTQRIDLTKHAILGPPQRDGRLLAARLWTVASQPIIVIIIYGISGAQTEQAKKKIVMNKWLEAIHLEMVGFGDIPCFLLGDFNMDLSRSPFLQKQIEHQSIFNTAALDTYQGPTSEHGNGNCIDHVLVNSSGYRMCQRRITTPGIADHLAITLELLFPARQQLTHSQANFEHYDLNLDHLKNTHIKIPDPLKTKFHAACTNMDVDEAWRIWCDAARHCLTQAAQATGGAITPGKPKGYMKLIQKKLQAPMVAGHGASLYLAKIYQLYTKLTACLRMPPGQQARNTFKNALRLVHYLPADQQLAFRHHHDIPDNQDLIELINIVDGCIHTCVLTEKESRIKEWKRRLQLHQREAARWIKRAPRKISQPLQMENGHLCGSAMDKLQALHNAWSQLYCGRPPASHHTTTTCSTTLPSMTTSTSTPSSTSPKQEVEQFLSKFARYIPKHSETASPDREQLNNVIRALPHTAPGPDGWRAEDLQALNTTTPMIIDWLYQLYGVISVKGSWPQSLYNSVIVMLGKEVGERVPTPMDVRPILLTSIIYRTWARWQLISLQHWVPEKWPTDMNNNHTTTTTSTTTSLSPPSSSSHSTNSRPWEHYNIAQHGADMVALTAQLEMERKSYEGQTGKYAGGISYDLNKAFDRIPLHLLWALLETKGASQQLLRPLRSFYHNLRRWLSFERRLAPAFIATRGIIQGCPLSMLLFSLFTLTLQNWLRDIAPEPSIHIYADDITAIARQASPARLTDYLINIHKHIQIFLGAMHALINHHKTFTFGDVTPGGIDPTITNHKLTFRLLGTSMVGLRSSRQWTEHEQQQHAKWTTKVKRIARAPLSWTSRCKLIGQTMTSLCWGQGLHARPVRGTELNLCRSNLLRAMWNVSHYNSAPELTIDLLMNPHLDPSFQTDYQALMLMWRAKQIDPLWQVMMHMLRKHPRGKTEGPVTRLRQLLRHPILGHLATKLLQNQGPKGAWQHDIRQAWRQHIYTQVAQRRPAHFGGIEHGIDKTKTLSLLRLWEKEGEEIQKQVNAGDLGPEPAVDPRPRQKILRLLLTGGLLTQARVWKHRTKKKDLPVTCICGHHDSNNMHIQWECPRYNALREPLSTTMADLERTEVVPNCVRYALLVPTGSSISTTQIQRMQAAAVDIWQQHIVDYHNLQSQPDSVVACALAPPPLHHEHAQDRQDAWHERNGHAIAYHNETKQLFCRKCGKCTSRHHHLRLKITRRPCRQASLPQDKWLTKPGALVSERRLDQAEKDMHALNIHGHQLQWNRLCGKIPGTTTFGIIKCSRCEKQWPWAQRHQALQRIVCTTNTSLTRNDPTTTTSSSDAHAHAEAQPRVLKRPSTRQLESHTTKRARLGIG